MNTIKRMYEMSKEMKEKFPPGTRIKLLCMNDSIHPIPSGMKGTVDSVDDAGTIHINWDNGGYLGVIYGEDKFRKLTDAELAEEK